MISNLRRFYTYALLDPTNPGFYEAEGYLFFHQPFYIGKGTGNRVYTHLYSVIIENDNSRKIDAIKKIREQGSEPLIFFVAENLSAVEAFDLETRLIKNFGRMDIDSEGILTNLSDNQGFVNSESHITIGSTREKISKSNKIALQGNIPWNKGVPCEYKENISEACKGSHGPNDTSFKLGAIPWNIGQKLEDENIRKNLRQGHSNKRNKYSKKTDTRIYFQAPDGFIYLTDNVNKFSKEFGLKQSGLSRLQLGNIKSYNSWLFLPPGKISSICLVIEKFYYHINQPKISVQ